MKENLKKIIVFVTFLFLFLMWFETEQKKIRIQSLNTLWSVTMESTSGTVFQNTEWKFGDEQIQFGNVIKFENMGNWFYYKRSEYSTFVPTSDEPNKIEEIIDGGKIREVKTKGNKLKVEFPVNGKLSLENLLSGIWEELSLSNVKSITQEVTDIGKRYRIIFFVPDEKMSIAKGEDGRGSVILQEKNIWIEIDEKEKVVHQIDYYTSGETWDGAQIKKISQRSNILFVPE